MVDSERRCDFPGALSAIAAGAVVAMVHPESTLTANVPATPDAFSASGDAYRAADAGRAADDRTVSDRLRRSRLPSPKTGPGAGGYGLGLETAG